jgi:hypothetical protein
MTDEIPEGARAAPSTARNRDVILAAVGPHLPQGARVLEIASGAGEHAVHFARARPDLRWQPTDPGEEARASIAAWRAHAALPNLAAPLNLDAAEPSTWPSDPADAVVCINMIHISPWASAQGLFAGAGGLLQPGGKLILYGPFLEADVATAPSNLDFDRSLKTRNPAWGLRELAAVDALAKAHGLHRVERIAMPANNLTVVFRKL